MLKGVDCSDFHPTPAQLQQMYAQGIRVVGGYLPGPGIYSGHTAAFFAAAKAAGMVTVSYASGWADPGQMKALSASWGVDYPFLDDEPGIRPLGAWEQTWLDASGFGEYFMAGAGMRGLRAPYYQMADYLGPSGGPYKDPQATWLPTTQNPTPPQPHGWQWAGSVSAYGGTCDLSYWDDYFAQGEGFLAALTDQQQTDLYNWTKDLHAWAEAADLQSISARVKNIEAFTGQDRTNGLSMRNELDDILAKTVSGGSSGPLKVTLTGTAQP